MARRDGFFQVCFVILREFFATFRGMSDSLLNFRGMSRVQCPALDLRRKRMLKNGPVFVQKHRADFQICFWENGKILSRLCISERTLWGNPAGDCPHMSHKTLSADLTGHALV